MLALMSLGFTLRRSGREPNRNTCTGGRLPTIFRLSAKPVTAIGTANACWPVAEMIFTLTVTLTPPLTLVPVGRLSDTVREISLVASSMSTGWVSIATDCSTHVCDQKAVQTAGTTEAHRT